MNDSNTPPSNKSRRFFLTRSAVTATLATVGSTVLLQSAAAKNFSIKNKIEESTAETEPFWGVHQGGITTPMQRHTYFIAFDLTTIKREEVISLLQSWTKAAAIMTQGPIDAERYPQSDKIPSDSGATQGLTAARLTITFGFGAGLFKKEGRNPFGLENFFPEALTDLPKFTGDQLVPERTGSDLSVQACADDPQVVEYAVRRLTALAHGIAKIRWAQTGFSGGFKKGETPRNQMGFKDGTLNISTKDPASMRKYVWVGDEGPAWLRDGSYMVIRPIRIALEHWDQMKLGFQEETVGRHKYSGAPIGKLHEFDALDLDATDKNGNPFIAENAHVRLSAPQNNDGAQILRRAYSYNNGVAFITERWPPWKQSTTFDAGLLFQCYQRDPRTGFTKLFENMAKFDMLNQFTTHVGSGLFACPPAAKPGEYIGQRLFESV